MLDRMNADVGTIEMPVFKLDDLSHLECRLIGFYRQLNKREQDHLRRLCEVLGAHPEQFQDD